MVEHIIKINGGTGITGLENVDTAIHNDIYTSDGLCIKRNAIEEDLRFLPSGLYIMGGKKIRIK